MMTNRDSFKAYLICYIMEEAETSTSLRLPQSIKIQLLPCCRLIRVTSVFITDSSWEPINVYFHMNIIQTLPSAYSATSSKADKNP